MLFISIIVLYFIANGWIFYSLWPSLRVLPPFARGVATTLLVAAALLFPLLIFFRNTPGTGRTGNFLYSASSIWLVITLYLAILFILVALLRITGVTVSHYRAICCGITTLLLIYGYLNFTRVAIRKMEITLESENYCKEEEKIRIVMASDIHLGYGISKRRLKKYVSLIRDCNPDLILICGDLIDSSVDPLYEEKMEEELKCLKAKYGIYMVPGNHEYISGIEKSARFLKQTPIRLLRDSVVKIGKNLTIVGRDDNSNRNRKRLHQLMAVTESCSASIVLDHQPIESEIESAIKEKAGIALYGHTHKGQIWPLSLLTKAIYPHNYGYEKAGHTHIYVSSGLGLWGPPLRIGSRSEIAVIELTLRNRASAG